MIEGGNRQEIPPEQAADTEVLITQSLTWRVVEGSLQFASNYNDDDEDTNPHPVNAGGTIDFLDPDRGCFSVENRTAERAIVEPTPSYILRDVATFMAFQDYSSC